MTKSAMATPGLTDWQVRTVKMEGSCNYVKYNKIGDDGHTENSIILAI